MLRLLLRDPRCFLLQIFHVSEVAAALFGERGDLAFRHFDAVLGAAERGLGFMDLVLKRRELVLGRQGIGPGLFDGRLDPAERCMQLR